MPCIKCSNGKWKYGENGNCVFDTLAACNAAAAAIHINEPNKEDTSMAKKPSKKPVSISTPAGPHQAPSHPYMSQALPVTPVSPEIVDNPCSSTHEDMDEALKAQYK